MIEETAGFDRLKRLGWASALIGIVCLIAWIAGYLSDPSVGHRQAMYGYLFGFIFWGTLTIGAFGMMLLQGSLKAAWGIALSRLMDAAGGPPMLFLLFVMFIPIGLPGIGLDALYSWTDTARMRMDPTLAKKLFYLNPTGFWIRTLVIIAIWLLFSYLLKRSSLKQDKTLDTKEWGFRSNLGSPGIVMFFLTMLFIPTDWVMSLQPKYYSTIYGIIFAIGCAISAMSLGVLMILYNSDKPPFRATVTPKLTRDFGNVFLCLTMLWAYTTLAQFLITWEGNLPMESAYYLRRSGSTFFGGQNHLDWNLLSNIVILFQFFIPFFALLAPRTKRVVKNMIWLCFFLLITRIFTVYWLIFPDVRMTEGFGGSLTHWTDYAGFLGLGGIWFAIFVSQFLKAPLLPKYDTRLMEAEHV